MKNQEIFLKTLTLTPLRIISYTLSALTHAFYSIYTPLSPPSTDSTVTLHLDDHNAALNPSAILLRSDQGVEICREWLIPAQKELTPMPQNLILISDRVALLHPQNI